MVFYQTQELLLQVCFTHLGALEIVPLIQRQHGVVGLLRMLRIFVKGFYEATQIDTGYQLFKKFGVNRNGKHI